MKKIYNLLKSIPECIRKCRLQKNADHVLPCPLPLPQELSRTCPVLLLVEKSKPQKQPCFQVLPGVTHKWIAISIAMKEKVFNFQIHSSDKSFWESQLCNTFNSAFNTNSHCTSFIELLLPTKPTFFTLVIWVFTGRWEVDLQIYTWKANKCFMSSRCSKYGGSFTYHK